MSTTSASLLQRLRGSPEQEAWSRFVKLYTPLLYYWSHRLGLQDQDAADLVQEVLATLVQKLPNFTYEPDKSFRGWLRTILLNHWRNRRRRRFPLPLETATGPLDEQTSADIADIFAEAEYRQRIIERALELMQSDFEPATWKAFWECQVNGKTGAEVAAALGLSVGAVYVAKSRVLRRLREELAGLLD